MSCKRRQRHPPSCSTWTYLPQIGPSASGQLPGGYGQEDLERARAYRVDQDPADLLRHLDEIGIRDTE